MADNIKIDRGVTFDGDDITQAGIGNYILLINKEDLDNGAITEDGTSHEIETITLDDGTYAYRFESSKGALQLIPSSPLRKRTGIDGVDHQIEIKVDDISQLSRENILRGRFQKLVALLPLSSGKSVMYGRYVGMRIYDYQESPGDADVGGLLTFTLKTPDEDPPEKEAPQLIEDTFDITSLEQS